MYNCLKVIETHKTLKTFGNYEDCIRKIIKYIRKCNGWVGKGKTNRNYRECIGKVIEPFGSKRSAWEK